MTIIPCCSLVLAHKNPDQLDLKFARGIRTFGWMRIFLQSCLFAVAVTILLQALVSGSPHGALLWPFSHPIAFGFSTAFLTLLIHGTTLVIGAHKVGALLWAGLFLGLGLASFLKSRYLGMPLFPNDLFLSRQSLIFAIDAIVHSWIFAIAVIVGTTTLTALAWHFFPSPVRIQAGWKGRVVGGFACFLGLGFLVLSNNPLHDNLFETHLRFVWNRPHASIAANGFIPSFISLVREGTIAPPTTYSKQGAQSLLARYPALSRRSLPRLRPDIVVVMSESLFDPTLLKGVKWHRDPLKFTRSMAGTSTFNNAVVPTFGGKTANSEFEFLTGHAIANFAQGAIPYEMAITKPQLSLVKPLKDAGYRAIAIHPGSRTFWNRDAVYRNFGFDKFISDDDFKDSPYLGHYYADDAILPHLEASLADTRLPSFHFIVTLQNHMPYDNPFNFADLLFDPEGMAAAEKVALNHYSKLVEATDRFHEKLVELLRRRPRPTLLVIFGDHLPPLMPNFGGFYPRMVGSSDPSQWSPQEWQAMSTTPMVLWSNFPFSHVERSPIEVSFLGIRLLDALGIPLPPYHQFLLELSQQIRIVHPNLSGSEEEKERSAISNYRLLQYHVLKKSLSSDVASRPVSTKSPN